MAWPIEIQSALLRWQNVTSVAYDESGREVSGTIVKRWTCKDADTYILLTEDLPTTLKAVLNDPSDVYKGGQIKWVTSTIKSSDTLTLEPFVWGAGSGSDRFTIAESKPNKLVLNFPEQKFTVVLRPSLEKNSNNRFLSNSLLLKGVSTTPDSGRTIGNAAYKTQFGIDFQPFPGPRYYLNHPIIEGSRKIVVSLNYPDLYLHELKKMIDEWNGLFGHAYYSFLGKRSLSNSECLTENFLCIQWNGGERFTWTGYHGSTELAADPGTGQVLGGIIYLYNDADEAVDRTGTPEELTLVENPFSFQALISGFSKIAMFSQVWRPDSRDLVKWLLLHEMGHFFGWDHNFAGAWSGSVHLPGATVMGYPPFNAAAKLTRLGDIDRQNYRSLYEGVNPENLTKSYCGDLDIVPVAEGKIWTKKVPECLMWSAGSSVDWLIANAKALGNWRPIFGWGVYKTITPQNEKLGSFIATLGFIAKSGSSTLEREKARGFLCRQSLQDPTILPFLSHNLALELDCN